MTMAGLHGKAIMLVRSGIVLLACMLRPGTGQVPFTDVRQLSGDAAAQVCPCVLSADGTWQCVMYDPTLAAVTEQEAIMNFDNLADKSASRGKPSSEEKRSNKCKGAECKSCAKEVIDVLEHKGYVTHGRARGLYHSMNITVESRGGGRGKACGKVKGHQRKTADGIQNGTMAELDAVLGRARARAGAGDAANNNGNGKAQQSSGRGKGQGRGQANFNRAKRQAGMEELGEVWEISCTRKGDVESADGGYANLCTQCWVWRVLPDTYYPRYINEVHCEPDDNTCLSDYGECRPTSRSMTVLRNEADAGQPPTWRSVSLNAYAACDCMVKADSVLYAWIAK